MKIVVAKEDELSLCGDVGQHETIVTGVGALNVIQALMDVDRDEPLFNIGYAGSNNMDIGTRVRVGRVGLHHPNVEFESPEFILDGNTPCYTSNDFVLKSDDSEPCVFDMELAYILAMGFKNVISEKIVSDNLSLKDYMAVACR